MVRAALWGATVIFNFYIKHNLLSAKLFGIKMLPKTETTVFYGNNILDGNNIFSLVRYIFTLKAKLNIILFTKLRRE